MPYCIRQARKMDANGNPVKRIFLRLQFLRRSVCHGCDSNAPAGRAALIFARFTARLTPWSTNIGQQSQRLSSGVTVNNSAILRVECPDQKGLDGTLADCIFRANGNILHFEQHQVAEMGLYLARIEWDLTGFQIEMQDFGRHFAPIAQRLNMKWQMALASDRQRVALFVSKYDHCLVDLLYRWHTGELACEIPLIISNHADAKRHADFYELPFHDIAVTPENTQKAERQQRALLEQHGIDLIVLARYMQVLSADFIAAYPQRIINIHHSFLPAFLGAKPHHQAFERGVKLIGATAHYVTEVLDDGPIIEHAVALTSHRDRLEDLVEKC